MSTIPQGDGWPQQYRTDEKLLGTPVWLHTHPGCFEVVAVLQSGRVRLRPLGDRGYQHATFHDRAELVLPFALG